VEAGEQNRGEKREEKNRGSGMGLEVGRSPVTRRLSGGRLRWPAAAGADQLAGRTAAATRKRGEQTGEGEGDERAARRGANRGGGGSRV